MDFRKINSFQQVAQKKSFSKASKALFLSQPAITSQISELETELGVKLFTRTKNSVELTEVGSILLTYVNQIIELKTDALTAIDDFKKGKSGTINLACTGPDCYWLFPLLETFRAYYNNVDINFSINFCPEIIDRVSNRHFHFGLVRDFKPTYLHPSLQATLVSLEDTILVVSPKHKFTTYAEVTMRDVSKEPLIIYGRRSSFWYSQLLPAFQNANVEPNVCVESSDHQATKLLVQSSWGVAFLPALSVKEELENGSLKHVIVKNCPPLIRYSFLLYRSDMMVNHASTAFLRMLESRGKTLQRNSAVMNFQDKICCE